MADESQTNEQLGRVSVKDRLAYAKSKRKKKCMKEGALIIASDNSIVCVIAQYGTNERKMRVVIDKITEQDIRLLKQVSVFPHQSREIWCSFHKEQDELGVELLPDDQIRILYDPLCKENRHQVMSASEFLSKNNPLSKTRCNKDGKMTFRTI